MIPEMIAQKVIALIAELQQMTPEEINLDSSFEDVHMDSLAALGLISELEDEFQITIPDEEMANIRLVRDVVEKLEQALSKTAMV